MGRNDQQWLIPEVGREVHEERCAAMREAAQRVRQEVRKAREHLKARDLRWIIDKLVDEGPQTECAIMFEQMTGGSIATLHYSAERAAEAFFDLWALWRVGKLWRVSQGIHPGSGEESFLYGIAGVHEKPKPRKR